MPTTPKPPLTIACSGTHGCGKTSLTNELAVRLHLEPINISRPTAAAQQLGYAKAADVPADQVQLFQWMGLFEQIHQERLRLERPPEVVQRPLGFVEDGPYILRPGFVSDRSVVDFLAYYDYRLASSTRYAEYAQLVRAYAQKYSAILYLPPNPNGVEDDNRRFIEGTTEIDDNITSILGGWCDLPVIEVPWTGEVSTRADYVIKELKERGLL
jgi:predicted ATPase